MLEGITLTSFFHPGWLVKPRYQHDCDKCRFVGQMEQYDFYLCNDTLIARDSDELSDYWSSPLHCLTPRYFLTSDGFGGNPMLREDILILLAKLEQYNILTTKYAPAEPVAER